MLETLFVSTGLWKIKSINFFAGFLLDAPTIELAGETWREKVRNEQKYSQWQEAKSGLYQFFEKKAKVKLIYRAILMEP